MQTNYYFLRQLAPQLAERLVGLVLAECFSQEKDELVLGFCPDGKQWRHRRDAYIRATLRGDLAALSFPDEFRRAGKNSVDLFPELLNRPVQAVRQFRNERCFALQFDEEWLLLFKLFGNRSNLILCHVDEVEELFNHKLVGDQNLKPSTLDRPLDQSFGAFERAQGDWKKLFPTFGKEVNRILETSLAGQTDLAVRWEAVQELLQKLENPTAYFVKLIDYQPTLSLLPGGGEVQKTLTDPITAANEFYYAYSRVSGIDREKAAALRALTRRIQKTEAYLKVTYGKLADLKDAVGHEEVGHILMANLHQIPERAEVVELYDFYRDQPIRIRLKPEATPQKNAEVYYRKARNEKIEVGKLQEAIEAREAERAELEAHQRAIEAIENLKELRKYLKSNLLEENVKVVETPETLFRKVIIDGYDVFIGRNARNNDLLTTRYARKEDLWLHARDVSGSHVVIRRKAGQNFPNGVIERAAQLAAWHSKRRTDGLCPVIVTLKKFVRKTRDLAEGQVIIDKEEVVMVVPENI